MSIELGPSILKGKAYENVTYIGPKWGTMMKFKSSLL